MSQLPTPFAPDHFDIITFVETIEHLKEDSLHETLAELLRLLRPGGRLLITTPFEEDLDAFMVYCPFCRSEFHQMQHMRSFTRASLRQLLTESGYRVLYCNNLNFRAYRSPLERIARGAMEAGKRWIKRRRGELVPPPPHLVAIATK